MLAECKAAPKSEAARYLPWSPLAHHKLEHSDLRFPIAVRTVLHLQRPAAQTPVPRMKRLSMDSVISSPLNAVIIRSVEANLITLYVSENPKLVVKISLVKFGARNRKFEI